MLRVSWTERKSNMNILENIRGRRELLLTVWKRQMAFLGRAMRVDGLENIAITGRIAESRSRGRPKKKYLDRIKEIIGGGITTQQLLTETRVCDQWRSINGYVCNGSPH